MYVLVKGKDKYEFETVAPQNRVCMWETIDGQAAGFSMMSQRQAKEEITTLKEMGFTEENNG